MIQEGNKFFQILVQSLSGFFSFFFFFLFLTSILPHSPVCPPSNSLCSPGLLQTPDLSGFAFHDFLSYSDMDGEVAQDIMLEMRYICPLLHYLSSLLYQGRQSICP